MKDRDWCKTHSILFPGYWASLKALFSRKEAPMKYGIFDKHDEYVPLGKWADDQDAYIAISEHGLDMELGEEYYVAPISYRMHDNKLIIEPGEYS